MDRKTVDTLLIHIEHSKPIELGDFVKSLSAIGALYSDYAQQNGQCKEAANSKLYVEKIEYGCIDVFLKDVVAGTMIPFVENVNLILEFAGYIKDTVNYLKNREGSFPKMTIKQLRELKDLFEVTSKDEKGKTEIGAISASDKANIFVGCTFTFGESNSFQNQVSKMIDYAKEDTNGNIHYKQLMRIYQMRDNVNSKGNKAIIDSISNKRLPVTFDNDSLAEEILRSQDNPMLKAYLVDVEVMTLEGKPSVYNVLKLHEIINTEE